MKSKQIQHSENVEMQVEHLIQDMDVKMDLNEKQDQDMEVDGEWEDCDEEEKVHLDDNKENQFIQEEVQTAQKLNKQKSHVHFNEGPKMFDPSEWSLDWFIIGIPLARGKYGHCMLAWEKTT